MADSLWSMVINSAYSLDVMPAEAGIQSDQGSQIQRLDSRLRENDKAGP